MKLCFVGERLNVHQSLRNFEDSISDRRDNFLRF